MVLPRKTIMAVCCFLMAVLSLATVAPATCVTAIAAELGMDSASQGAFLGMPFWGLTVAILIAGPLADRWGFRALLVSTAFFESAGLALMHWAGHVGVLMAGAFLLGCGSGVADALLTPIACALFPERRSRVTALLHSFYPIGLILNVSLVLLMMHLHWPWRSILLALAMLPVPCLLAVLALPLPAQSHEGQVRMRARDILLQKPFLLLMGLIFLAGVTEIGPSAWLPAFMEKVSGNRAQGGLGLMMFGVTMAASRLSLTAVVHRVGERRLYWCSGILSVVCLLTAALAPWPVVTLAALTLLGVGVAALWPMTMGCAGNRYPQAGASMFSLLSAAGNFGGVVGPVAIGLVADNLGIKFAMATLAVGPVLVIVLMSKLLRQPRSATIA